MGRHLPQSSQGTSRIRDRSLLHLLLGLGGGDRLRSGRNATTTSAALLHQRECALEQLLWIVAGCVPADFNNDGFVRLDEYNKVQGVEKRIFDDVLEDAGKAV